MVWGPVVWIPGILENERDCYLSSHTPPWRVMKGFQVHFSLFMDSILGLFIFLFPSWRSLNLWKGSRYILCIFHYGQFSEWILARDLQIRNRWPAGQRLAAMLQQLSLSHGRYWKMGNSPLENTSQVAIGWSRKPENFPKTYIIFGFMVDFGKLADNPHFPQNLT